MDPFFDAPAYTPSGGQLDYDTLMSLVGAAYDGYGSSGPVPWGGDNIVVWNEETEEWEEYITWWSEGESGGSHVDSESGDIVVTAGSRGFATVVMTDANRITIGPDHFAYPDSNGNFFIVKESDWFWNRSSDSHLGTFRRATQAEADLVATDDSGSEVSGSASGDARAGEAGVEVRAFTNGGVTTYWVRVGQ